MLSLVQIEHPTQGRRVAHVMNRELCILNKYRSAYACAHAAIQNHEPLDALIGRATSDAALDYDAIYAGQSEWRLLPAWDHPDEPARCLVSGTGLTHRKSADNRNAMHQSGTRRRPPPRMP